MEQKKQYLSRFGNVWRKKGSKEALTDKLILKDKETIAMYEQIPKPKAKDNKTVKGPAVFNSPNTNN